MPKIKVGIMYDFDKTLCTTDMQNYTFMSDIGMKPEEFWGECSVVTKKHEMDKILTYMYLTIKKTKEKGIKLTKEYLNSLGKGVVLYRGVSTWFDRINEFAESKGVEIEHYIISSGVKEIIEGTSIAKYFKKIYDCKFIYDEETKEAIWPAMAINFTQKTQYIFRISKGALDETEEEKLNCYSSIVTIEFDPEEVLIDNTNENYQKATNIITKMIDGKNYIKSITLPIDAISSADIRFYKLDSSKNYTYPNSNNKSVVNVTTK